MALSQRPASRFFAAFYRWNLHTQPPHSCNFSSRYSAQGRRHPSSSYLRQYHATRLLRQQGQPESQLQCERTVSASGDTQDDATVDTDQIVEGRPATATQEEANTIQQVSSTEGEESPTESFEPDLEQQELKEAVRVLLRKVPSSVAIITVESVDPHTKKHVPMGVAVSSLTSVTLDPPTISFNIKQPSKTLDAIRAANGLFRVHFPGANLGGANVVEHFCRGNHPDAYDLRLKDLKIFVPSDWKDVRATVSRAPQIWNDSICAAMECAVTHEFPVADHVIIAARVGSLEQKTLRDFTIVYVDGKYTRSDSTIAPHGRPKISAQSEGSWSVWDFPLFPGEQERKDYVEHIKTTIKDNPAYLDKPGKEAYRELQLELPYPPSNFGINIFNLLAKCRQDARRKNLPRFKQETMPILFDFYGRLSPSTVDKILNRASQFVREDPSFLSLNYRVFLEHLSVNSGSRDFLPSDIMTSLRAEGLVSEFKSSKRSQGPSSGRNYDIKKLEQVEHQLREHLRTLTYGKALDIRFEDVLRLLGEDTAAATYFKRCRSRLLAESHPQKYNDPKVDIVGEVTQEEARVVLSRVITFLQIRNLFNFRKNINQTPYEMLRVNGVHPTITGMDIEYLFGKIKHLYYSTRFFRDFAGAINNMLEPWFDNTVSWDDLDQRVKNFVKKTPLRATSWSNRDKLAAMGLDWGATVMVPVKNMVKNQQPLNKGLILDTLVAKELKNHYGNGTEEENRGIAKYLKEVYNFDVDSRPIARAAQSSVNRSSSDDLQEAMMSSLNMDRRSGHQNLFRKHSVDQRKQPRQESSSKQSTDTEWTKYSLGENN
ncbi:uncharacterized protein K460DRAFT_397141 [Cucurbitaria berberidis CBS 394.84]|uniref:Flavin reductase like domain-containing protein n=1 Tax=Cucurbitaria berberidis CBS 394.84 TaxID=1168544 RepID=A0A9P4GEW1_9PLEO|nr:uncharacterized protein K460DRAFT_397141 [Cucurbitaria berberidis CBS 394.84]KAF1843954.1 hypothetical protein K460DRAFT_397141 [Cucurbitaria berberidis CBS 394.84]